MSISVEGINFLIEDENLFEKNVSIRLQEKEKVLLYGPSGSGKTSIFNMFTYFLHPSCGDVFYSKNKIKSFNEANKTRSKYISLIDSHFSFFNNLSIQDNIKAYAHFAKIPNVTINLRLNYMLDNFKFKNENISLCNLYNKKVSNLSNGQKEIIMISRAIMLGSKFIFADELLRSFNMDDKKDIFDKLIKSLDYFNMGLFMISHEDTFKKYKSIDRILTIKNKTLQEENRNE